LAHFPKLEKVIKTSNRSCKTIIRFSLEDLNFYMNIFLWNFLRNFWVLCLFLFDWKDLEFHNEFIISRILLKQKHLHQNDLVQEQQQQHHDNVIQKLIQQQITVHIQIKMVIHQLLKMELFQHYLLKKN